MGTGARTGHLSQPRSSQESTRGRVYQVTKRRHDFETLSHQKSFGYSLLVTGVSVVPGGAYGVAGYFRVSFAAATEDLAEGAKRIRRACVALE